MINKKIDIQDTREITGWAYYGMKWLTKDKVKEANKKRNELLQSISDRANSNFLGNKIGPGKLSPGCMSCGQGTWSCIFINCLCTANCFYCPQDPKNKKDQPPVESGLIFDNPDDYVDYLEKFKFKGASFSGGEPLLEYEKVLTYTRKIRERLGKGIYIWLYTNGDLVDKKRLNALKEAGLNEIRFDIAARNYNLKALKMAIGIIDTVTVEIPAVPEDYEILKRCLPLMKAIGVAHLNLHQLFANQHCYKQFNDRRYTFLHQPNIPVLESEMTALRIIKYAVDKNIGLPINYCCSIYKHRFQQKAYRERFQTFIKERYEGSTESGFIRRLAIPDKSVNIKKLVKIFQENKCNDSLWSLNKDRSELIVHHSLLKYIDFNKHGLIVTYFAPPLTSVRDEGKENSKEIALNSRRNIFIERKFVHEMKINNPVAIKSFQELFIKKINNGDVFKKFYRDYDLKTKADIDEMMIEKDRLDYLKTWEFIGSGLYEIY
jgi:pyruvate formate-lyase activating enzyme-like uncharacterized protein